MKPHTAVSVPPCARVPVRVLARLRASPNEVLLVLDAPSYGTSRALAARCGAELLGLIGNRVDSVGGQHDELRRQQRQERVPEVPDELFVAQGTDVVCADPGDCFARGEPRGIARGTREAASPAREIECGSARLQN